MVNFEELGVGGVEDRVTRLEVLVVDFVGEGGVLGGVVTRGFGGRGVG